jgi:hypothetical protein
MNRNGINFAWTAALAAAFILIFAGIAAHSEPMQTRIYDAHGNSIGTATRQGDGSIRYRDAGGNSTGTSTTTNSGAGLTTKFYDARGNVTGTTSSPLPLGRR